MPLPLLKKLGVVVVLLLVAWILYLYRLVPHSQNPFEKADPQSGRIVLERGSRRAELMKDGAAWKVTVGTMSAVADDDKVLLMVSGLQDVVVEDEISARADRVGEFDVNVESGTWVSLFAAAGSKPLAEGIFGKQARDFSHFYFRYPDRPNVYLARGSIRSTLDRLEMNYWMAVSTVTAKRS